MDGVNGSWWAVPIASPSADQTAGDGMSTFTKPGVDYFNRSGIVKVKLRPDATSASDLGLPVTGETVTTPLRPLEIRVVGYKRALILGAVDSFTIRSKSDRIVSVDATYAGNGDYKEVFSVLEQLAPNCGWTAADLKKLESDLVVDQRAKQGDLYSAQIGPSDAIGAGVSATVTVDLKATGTQLTFHVAAESP